MDVDPGRHLFDLDGLDALAAQLEEAINIGGAGFAGQPEHEIPEGFERVDVAPLDREARSSPFFDDLGQARPAPNRGARA